MHTITTPREDATDGGRFTYFMVRVHVSAQSEPSDLAGMVEWLGTGQKHSFGDGQDLLNLLFAWSGRSCQDASALSENQLAGTQ
jgi:hypothetical protein